MTGTVVPTEHLGRAVPGLGTIRVHPSCAVARATGPMSLLDAVAGGTSRAAVLAVTVDDGGRLLELPVPSQQAIHRCFGPVPPAGSDLDEPTVRALRNLVLDGVLEFEADEDHEDTASSRSGPATWSRLCDRPVDEGGGALHHVSVEAVRHGQSFGPVDPGHLTARLYFFHRQPATPAWRYRLPTIATVEQFLQLDRTMAVGKMRASWRRSTRNNPRENGWIYYRSSLKHPRRDSPHYKVYVSPRIEQVPDLVALLPDLVDGEVVDTFKVGAHLYALLRPDKFVLYCSSLDAVRAIGDRFAEGLAGMEPHGVPFTAPLSRDGLVSWGVDPPPGYHAGSARERNSWRLWVCSLLADALVAAAGTPGLGLEPWEYALLRAGEEGVRLPGWEPPADFSASGGQ